MPRVLVVDPSIKVLGEVSRLLSEIGYEVHVAHNACVALSLLEKYEFRLVLSDYINQTPDSLECLTLIQSMKADKRFKHTPFIVWGMEDAKGISANVEENGGRFLIKNPPYSDLPAVVSQAIASFADTVG